MPTPQVLSAWSLCSAAREASTAEAPAPPLRVAPGSPQLEKSPHSKEDPAQPKRKGKNALKVRPCDGIPSAPRSFLKLSNTLLCYTAVCSSAVSGCSCCFHSLAVANNAAVNRGVQTSLKTLHSVLLGTHRGRVAESCGDSVFSFFEEPPYCFPQQLFSVFYIPSSAQKFQFLYILANTYLVF